MSPMTTTDPFVEFERTLEENGFAKDAEDISESFGDRMIVMKRRELLVRFVRDRDHQSIDVASTKDRDLWFDGAVVLEMFGRGLAKDPAPVQTQIAELRALLPRVIVAFDRKNFKATRKQLEKIEHARAQALFGDLFRR